MSEQYLIVFMSHHGTTRKLAHLLADKLGKAHTTVIDLAKDHVPDFNAFSTILIGGSIHVGQIQKGVQKFYTQYKAQLLTKRLGLFLCFMNRGEGLREFEMAFPEELRNHAIAHGMFGGELLFEKMNFFERFITKKMSGHTKSVSEIDYAAVEEFVDKVTKP